MAGRHAGLIALLQVLLAARSEAHHVASRLIASVDEIDRLVAEDAPDIPALSGWRRDVFSADALALKAGRIALGVERGRFRPDGAHAGADPHHTIYLAGPS